MNNFSLNLRCDQIAPFESSFSVFLKIICLSLIDKRTLFSRIRKCKTGEDEDIKYWLGDWVDLERFSDATKIPISQIRSCFIDNIIPIHGESSVCIRHCPACIKKGYHSVFFYIHSVTFCPIHDEELIACIKCTNALKFGNLRPRKASNAEGGAFSFSLKCGHFSFDSDMGVYLCNYDDYFRSSILEKMPPLLKWLADVSRMNSSCGDFLLRCFNGESDARKMISTCVGFCEQKIGAHPAYKIEKTIPKTTLIYRPGDESEFQSESYVSIFKSVRRYIYKKFIREHAKCYRALKVMDKLELCCLDVRNACAASSAYIAWLHVVQIRSTNSLGEFLILPVWDKEYGQASLKDMAYFWLSHFLGIFGGIERELEFCLAHDQKFNVEESLNGSKRGFALSPECVFCSSLPPRKGLESTLLVPDGHYLSRASFKRCLGRLNKNRAISSGSTWVINFWAYTKPESVIMRFWTREGISRKGPVRSVLTN